LEAGILNARSSRKNDTSVGASPEIKIKCDEFRLPTPLRTKLGIPPARSSWIARSRLSKRMNEGFARKRTLISAPAGFGLPVCSQQLGRCTVAKLLPEAKALFAKQFGLAKQN
jgi:hypothetical protein